MKTISVKILGHKRAQRYPVERAVIAAQQELPNATLIVEYIETAAEIQKYTPVFSMPSLMVNEKLVCVGRFPTKVEVLSWLREAENS
ncbi:MAG: thioredoxin family protein [Anaerolineales bacterium]|nr:thioredoxin family protein [Anaerolineales bacterium]